LSCMIEVARAYRTGERPPTLHELLPGTRAALKAEQEVLLRLVASGLLHPVAAGGNGDGRGREDEGYVPARDPSLITVEEIVEVLEREGATPAALDTGEPVSALAREILDQAAKAAAGITAAISLADAVGRVTEGRVESSRAEEAVGTLPGAPGTQRA
jgi:DNA-binding IscR family transcriptional regulator